MRRTRSHSLAELRVSLGLDKQEAVGGLLTALRNGTTVHYAVAWVKYYRIAFCQTGQYLGYPAIPVAYRDRRGARSSILDRKDGPILAFSEQRAHRHPQDVVGLPNTNVDYHAVVMSKP